MRGRAFLVLIQNNSYEKAPTLNWNLFSTSCLIQFQLLIITGTPNQKIGRLVLLFNIHTISQSFDALRCGTYCLQRLRTSIAVQLGDWTVYLYLLPWVNFLLQPTCKKVSIARKDRHLLDDQWTILFTPQQIYNVLIVKASYQTHEPAIHAASYVS